MVYNMHVRSLKRLTMCAVSKNVRSVRKVYQYKVGRFTICEVSKKGLPLVSDEGLR